jgi:uncharacterized protein
MNTPPPLPSAQAAAHLPPPAVFSPIAEGQREPLLDALRGFAILGIFIVNMIGFKSPMIATAALGERWHEGAANNLTLVAIEVLAMWKFVTLFALLFGFGIALQYQRAEAAGRAFRPFFLRRMVFLLVLGVVHGIFLWAGDVLATYALCGLFGLLFLQRSAAVLLKWAAGWLGFVLLMVAGLMYLHAVSPGDDEAMWRNLASWWHEAYSSGFWGEIVLARLVEWGLMWFSALFFFVPYVFALFLLGMALGKFDLLEKLGRWRRGLGLFVALAIPIGVLFNWIHLARLFEAPVGAGAFAIGFSLSLLGSLLLSLSYALLIYFLVSGGRCSWLVRRLAAVGRLALTNYLLQSVIANVLFMSWGFGLYGKLEAQEGLVIVGVVFLMQLWLSPVWLRYFRLGPMEWVWRRMTYGEAPPIRRAAS